MIKRTHAFIVGIQKSNETDGRSVWGIPRSSYFSRSRIDQKKKEKQGDNDENFCGLKMK